MAGLYLHVPFRRARRPYDDSAYDIGDTPGLARYETAVCRELRDHAPSYATDEPITTLYVGGGRPSLLPRSTLDEIVGTLFDIVDRSAIEEVTVEVAPVDATPRSLRTLRQLGVDRLSLSVLSFSPAVLRSVAPPHTAADAQRALDRVQEIGFDSVSIDLLFGHPSQSVDVWETTLRHALDRGVPHITIMEASPSSSSTGEERADQMERAMTLLRSEGYEQYELTHFAAPGHRSAHQENYYAHGNYLGVGPSAESFWWTNRLGSGPARRWSNVNSPNHYADRLDEQRSAVAVRQTLSRQALAQEYVFLRLRTDAGLDLDRLATQYGVNLREESPVLLDRLRSDELIYDTPDRVRLTPRGRLLTDAITTRLLPS